MDKDLLDIYTDYLISQTKYATATKLSDILDQEVSHDKITRFLSKSDLTNLEFWKYRECKLIDSFVIKVYIYLYLYVYFLICIAVNVVIL